MNQGSASTVRLLPSPSPGRTLADAAVAVWCAIWIWLGTLVHGVVVRLAAPARTLQDSAAEFRGAMSDAGAAVGQLPLAGGPLRSQFDRVGAVADQAHSAGVQFETLVGQTALLLGLVTALAPALGVGLPYLVARLRRERRVAAARSFVDSDADLELFALRALAHQPLPRLAGISTDPVGAVRRGDAETVRRLAAAELRDLGLRIVPAPGGEARRP